MEKLLDFAQIVSLMIVIVTGLGGLLWLACRMWDYAFTYLMNMYDLKKEFVVFMSERVRKNRTVKKLE